MKPIKWVEIALPNSKDRFTYLSEVLNQMGVPNEAHFIEGSRDNLAAQIAEAKKNFDHIRIGSPFTELAFDPKTELTATVQVVKAVDAFTKDDVGNWWPQSILFEAFIHGLAHRIKALDLNSSVLMVGAGGAARAVLSALARVGYMKFNITDRYQEKVQVLITDLKRTFFNLKFEYIPISGITALPGMHSLIVNTTPLLEENELIRELQFYNFMKEGGAVIDLTTIPPKTPLLEEAEHIGAKIVQGFEIAAEVDSVWVKKVTGKPFDTATYAAGLEKKFSEIKIDLTPFRQL